MVLKYGYCGVHSREPLERDYRDDCSSIVPSCVWIVGTTDNAIMAGSRLGCNCCVAEHKQQRQ